MRQDDSPMQTTRAEEPGRDVKMAVREGERSGLCGCDRGAECSKPGCEKGVLAVVTPSPWGCWR